VLRHRLRQMGIRKSGIVETATSHTLFFSLYKPEAPRTVMKLWDTLYIPIAYYKNPAVELSQTTMHKNAQRSFC